jgi:hypothetical protein
MSKPGWFTGVEFMAHRDGRPPLVPSTEEIQRRIDRQDEREARALADDIRSVLLNYPDGLTIKQLGDVLQQPTEGFIPCKAFHILMSAGELELEQSTKIVRLTGKGMTQERNGFHR